MPRAGVAGFRKGVAVSRWRSWAMIFEINVAYYVSIFIINRILYRFACFWINMSIG